MNRVKHTNCHLLFMLLLAMFFLPKSALSDQTDNAKFRLLVLGDSLSAGYGLMQAQSWVTLLQNAWQEHGIEVVNAAISGETSDGALARLPRLIEQHNPSHILVELGGNDGLQGHPVPKLKANLAAIIEYAQQHQVKVILQQMQIPTNYGKRYTQMFTQSYASLADTYNIPMLPFFLEQVALNPALMQKDGIHPNADAQPQIAVWMQQHLQPLIQAE